MPVDGGRDSSIDCRYYASREKRPSYGGLHETQGAFVWYASNQRIVYVIDDQFRDG